MKKEGKKTTPNDVVSPENTERLYGKKNLEGEESRPGDAETVETELPEDFSGVDQDVGTNTYPSHSDIDPHEFEDI